MRDTRKAEYILAVGRVLKDEFGESFRVAHCGDNHNEFGCEIAVDRLWVPKDADARLKDYLAAEAIPYEWELESECPSAGVAYVHEALLAFTGEGLPADLWP
jgi:hypothetical protein